MIEAVFIADLHLHPHRTDISQRFSNFINWARAHVRSVYILGDFLHAWPGDDALDAWSHAIALQLAELAACGIKIYFMHGNRDFLLGRRFAALAQFKILREPCVIKLGAHSVLLVHGDRYCLQDKSHQNFRRLTRNRIFKSIFLSLPYKLRMHLVAKVRTHSRLAAHKPKSSMEIVVPAMLLHMQKLSAHILIHGHIHKPGFNQHSYNGDDYLQYILSDWDENPLLMCYDNSRGFNFMRLTGD